MSKFEWHSLMKAGLHSLQLKPEEFWRLTPAELVLMLGGGNQAMPLERATMDALLARFPDKQGGSHGSD